MNPKLNARTPAEEVHIADKKLLVGEAKRLQKRIKEKDVEIQRLKQKVAVHRTHELALMQVNRMMADVIKVYADREAVLMTSIRTLQRAYEPPAEQDVVDLDHM